MRSNVSAQTSAALFTHLMGSKIKGVNAVKKKKIKKDRPVIKVLL